MVEMIPFTKAVKEISYPGLMGFNKKGTAIFGNVTVKNPESKVIEGALKEHVMRNSFKQGGVADIANVEAETVSKQLKNIEHLSMETYHTMPKEKREVIDAALRKIAKQEQETIAKAREIAENIPQELKDALNKFSKILEQ